MHKNREVLVIYFEFSHIMEMHKHHIHCIEMLLKIIINFLDI